MTQSFRTWCRLSYSYIVLASKQNPVSRKVTLLCNRVTADSFRYVLNRDQIDQRIASNQSLTVVVISLYNYINYNRMRLKQGEKLH